MKLSEEPRSTMDNGVSAERPTGFDPRAMSLRIAIGVAYCLGLTVIFGRPLLELAVYAWGSSLHSHVVLIPFIAAYLIAVDRHSLPGVTRGSFLPAGLFAGVGLIAFLLGGRYAPELS